MIAHKTPAAAFDEYTESGANLARRNNSLRQVVLVRGDGYWVAECPSLPGCTGQGRTRERAIESVKEAIANYLAELKECDLPVPEELFDALIVAV